MNDRSLKILFLAAEAVPFAKVGGLADVAGSLPKALSALGHDVRLMIPRYGSISSDEFKMEKIGTPFTIPIGPDQETIHLIKSKLNNEVPTYLIWNEHYFYSRDQVYGFDDDAQRFALFGKAALTALEKLDWQPDVIHANDWHTGLVPTWLDLYGQENSFFNEIATLFTIHNLTYQGIAGRLILTFAHMDDVEHLNVEQPGDVNWMAQAIAHSDLINTVSEQYAEEIMTPEIGGELAPLLNRREDRVFGVLNGLDYAQWDPETDTRISHRFDVDSLDRRAANKTVLQQQARLPTRSDAPLVGMVSRLDTVKGIDLMAPVLEWLLEEENAQFVVLGTGMEAYHEMFQRIQERFPERMHAFLKFDEALAHRIYAGADMFLMPSRVEPCGLGQMIAMRYGCVPLVRSTGGLADTVIDYTSNKDEGNGFTFSDYSVDACEDMLERALEVYREEKTAWRSIQERGMKRDSSWTASAKKYVELYKHATKLHQA